MTTPAEKAQSRLTKDQVVNVVREAGFTEKAVPKMVCAAYYLSTFDPRYKQNVSLNMPGSNARRDLLGLFAIGQWMFAPGRKCAGLDPFDPGDNATCAKLIYGAGGNMSVSEDLDRIGRRCSGWTLDSPLPGR